MVSGVHHLALRTRNLPRLEAFYTHVLGLSVRSRDETRSVWLEAGHTLVMLETASDDEPDIPPHTRELIAFTIAPEMRAPCTDLLKAWGVAVDDETRFTIYFRDPDGRRVALSHYPNLT